MYTGPKSNFNTTEAEPLANVDFGDATSGFKTSLAVEIPLLVLVLSTVGTRIYSRLAVKKRLAPDDVLIILGTCAAFARTVISCLSADDSWNYNRAGPERAIDIPYYQHIFERRIAYIFTVTFIRFSILAYYLRIFPPGLSSLRRCCYILIFLALVHFIEVLTVLLVYCKEIGKLWTSNWLEFSGSRCFSSAVYSYSAAIGDSVVDSMIFALPLPYVWRLSKLRARQRLGLMLVFGLGLIVCVVALLQIPFIMRRQGDTSYFGNTVNLLTAIQISLAIVAASLPDLRALIARNFPKFSPLHHRSLVVAAGRGASSGAQTGALHADQGSSSGDGTGASRDAFEGKRLFRKPDWLRSSLPGSLMSTRASQNEATRLSRLASYQRAEQVPRLPKVPERAVG